jgi:hypothetical protein
LLLLVASVGALLSFSILARPAAAAIPFCPAGAGPGQCESPQGVATDWETGRVYVADRGNGRINVFKADGTFLSSFGEAQLASPTWVAVDNDEGSASRHDVYVGTENFEVRKFKASGEFVKSFGGEGTGPCHLMRTDDPIAVGPDGDVNVADTYDKDGEGPLHVFVVRIQRFNSAGECLGEVKLSEEEFPGGGQLRISGLVVDAAGDSYVSRTNGKFVKYGPAGTFLGDLGGLEAKGLAIDATGNVFSKQRGEPITTGGSFVYFIAEYAPDMSLVRRFAYRFTDSPLGLAAFEQESGVEGLFASEPPSQATPQVNFLLIPQGPVIAPEPCHVKPAGLGSVRATLQAEINPEGKETHFHFEYSDGTETKTSLSVPLSGAVDVEMHEAAQLIEGLKPETVYSCHAVAENADGVASGEVGSFETKEGFEFGPGLVSDVGAEEATLSAQGNPLGLAATAVIEYVEDAKYQLTGFAEALTAPASELDYGAGETMQARSVTLTGLTPATTYHWRLHVRNGVPPQGLVCPRNGKEPCPANEHTFRTFGASIGVLGDGRAWELVSPPQKNGAEVGTPYLASGAFEDRGPRILASSGSGEAATYTSFTSFGKDAEGAPSSSQYLSKRTSGGWTTENISPFGFQVPVLDIPFKGFTPDLGFTAFKVTEGALTPDCPEGPENLYLRNNATGTLDCLTPEVPEHGDIGCLVYAGISEDGGRAFFASGPRYAGVPAGKGFSLYEWSREGGLVPISIVPGQSQAAAPTEGTVFGSSRSRVSVSNCQWGQSVMRHVISADGSKAFWTYAPEDEHEPTLLLAHIHGAETIQLDAEPKGQKGKEKPGAGPFGNGVFQAASTDGMVVYFTDTGKLISGSKAEAGKPDLYRYEFGKAEPLSDLTRGAVAGNVQDVVGASDDGSYVYFVAEGALTGEEEGAAGQKAKEGAQNLYLSHEGKTSFIARLAAADENDWSAQPKSLSARVSPDGRHLAFLSVEAEALAGYDNTVAVGEHCKFNQAEKRLEGGPLCSQGFVYDAESKTLSCASCNPSGARPLGPTLVPGWSNVYEGPRYLSDDGSRFFLTTFDALVRADENGKRDVYEFERPGTGSCSTQSDSYDPVSGGCHFLISSGRSEDESYFIDASSDGRDAFFSTRGALVGWDGNENFDVYDAREGGGFPEPSQAPSCQGEGCKPPASLPPSISSPPSFEGPGNPPARKPCKKGQVRKHGKCVKKQGKANHKRRPGR